MATMNISLPDDMKAHVEAQVASGQFANASDFIRDLIRYNQRELDLLRAAIRKGDESGVSPYTIDETVEQAFAEFEGRCV